MLVLIRDIGLSFCPAWVKTLHRPNSPQSVLRAATITGALQTYLCSRWFWSGFMGLLSLRGQQYGSALQHQNVATQGWFAVVLFFEYLMFHPLGLLFFYLSVEGLVRFLAGLWMSEAIPSFPGVVFFMIKRTVENRKARRSLQMRTSVPDYFEILGNGDQLNVASSLAKPRWNASITIRVAGKLYEVEREEKGTPPREHVYVLRQAPIGKILRAFEEYDSEAAAKSR